MPGIIVMLSMNSPTVVDAGSMSRRCVSSVPVFSFVTLTYSEPAVTSKGSPARLSNSSRTVPSRSWSSSACSLVSCEKPPAAGMPVECTRFISRIRFRA